MNKIVRGSFFLKWVVIALGVSLPIFEAGYWITCGYPFLEPFFHFETLPQFGSKPIDFEDINLLQRFLSFLINLIPLSFYIAALYHLAMLFKAFQRMVIFKAENVQILKKAGKALVFAQLAHPFYTMLLSLTLTFRNPVGQRNISIAIGASQLEILAIGLSILLVSWILQEAVLLKEEQEATV